MREETRRAAPARPRDREDIADRGYAIVPAFLSSRDVATLRGGAIAQERAGGFAPRQWDVARAARSAAMCAAIASAGSRRTGRRPPSGDCSRRSTCVALNRELQLGLSDLEAHYAIYPAGAG
jgi:hypothetical protein